MPAAGEPIWRLDLSDLVAVRQAPLVVCGPVDATAAGEATVELVFRAPRMPRRGVLLHHGDPFTGHGSPCALFPGRGSPGAGVSGGAGGGSCGGEAPRSTRSWCVALIDGRVEVQRRDASGARAWRGPRLRGGRHRVLVRFSAGGAPLGGLVDGRPLRAALPSAWDDVHGELPAAAGWVVGGLRDRAGGHTDLRFGERRGEWIERVTLWRGRPAPERAPSEERTRVAQAPDQPEGGGSSRAALRSEVPRASLHGEGDRWRFAIAGVEGDARVLWDFEDELAVGREVVRPAALVPSVPLVTVLVPGLPPRRARAPRRPTGPRPLPVFRPGDGGYAAFRIPALVRAADGALLAFAEGRRESVSDSCRTKDLVSRRSEDGGRVWGPLVVVARAPAGSTAGGGRSLMNPSPAVDTVHGSGRVVLLATHLTASEWSVAAGVGRGRLLAWASDDHGRSWCEAADVAAQLGLPEGVQEAWPGADGWRLQVGTLGHGVQLRRGPHPGRLCFVGHGTFGPASVFDALGFLFWSDDLGCSWQVGPAFTRREDGGAARGWNEGTLTELGDGRLLANARQYRSGRPAGCRASLRIDWGADGRPRPATVRDEPALVDSAVQGSLLAPSAARPDHLLFCNPAHPVARLRLTLRESDDGGASWRWSRLLVTGRVGYSDLAPLSDDGGAVGVLFESGTEGEVAFLRVPLRPRAADGACREGR